MVAKGFGKNYFRLTAITATANAVTLHKEEVRVKELFITIFDQEIDSPSKQSETASDTKVLEEGSKPCYCNLFFACLAHKVLRLSHINRPPLCRCRYTKTGVAPPSSIVF